MDIIMSYGSTGFIVEMQTIPFEGVEEAGKSYRIVTLSAEHQRAPHVVVTPTDLGTGTQNYNLNFHVEDITKSGCVVYCSEDQFSGTVTVSAISTL
jgi:hypothetical protein